MTAELETHHAVLEAALDLHANGWPVVPIDGPPGAGVNLNGHVQGNPGIVDDCYRISPDSQWVVYAEMQDSPAVKLYSVPIDGPSSGGIKLNGLLVPGGIVYGTALQSVPTAVMLSTSPNGKRMTCPSCTAFPYVARPAPAKS